VYQDPDLASGLAIPPATVRRIIEYAVPRPVTPIYTQLSEILQIQLHRALTRQSEPERALAQAQSEMQRLLNRVGLGEGERVARR
jgi:multiple sugar transport system substrate-binding protein